MAATEIPGVGPVNPAVAALVHKLTAPGAPGGPCGSMIGWKATRRVNDVDLVEVTLLVRPGVLDQALMGEVAL